MRALRFGLLILLLTAALAPMLAACTTGSDGSSSPRSYGRGGGGYSGIGP